MDVWGEVGENGVPCVLSSRENHQGLAGQSLEPPKDLGLSQGKVSRRQRLGGMLTYYNRAAA